VCARQLVNRVPLVCRDDCSCAVFSPLAMPKASIPTHASGRRAWRCISTTHLHSLLGFMLLCLALPFVWPATPLRCSNACLLPETTQCKSACGDRRRSWTVPVSAAAAASTEEGGCFGPTSDRCSAWDGPAITPSVTGRRMAQISRIRAEGR